MDDEKEVSAFLSEDERNTLNFQIDVYYGHHTPPHQDPEYGHKQPQNWHKLSDLLMAASERLEYDTDLGLARWHYQGISEPLRLLVELQALMHKDEEFTPYRLVCVEKRVMYVQEGNFP